MKKKIIALLLSVIMIFSLQPFRVQADDKSAALSNIVSTISQDGAVIDEGANLDSTLPIVIAVSFDVPVEGDEPTPANPVRKGDTASFVLSNSFNLISTSTAALNMGSLNVGHVHFTTDPVTGLVTADVTFDGEDAAFDGTYNTVKCSFSATFEYDGTGSAGDEGEHTVTILEKEFTVVVPPSEITYGVNKSGVVDLVNKSIEWTVQMTAIRSGFPVDLNGYKFSDDLTNVGSYIDGSFTVGGVDITPSIAGNIIAYTFPSSSNSPQTIKFKTEIPDNKYFASTAQNVINKAQLLNSTDTLMQEGQIQVNFTPQWIVKAGQPGNEGSSGVYNSTDRTITWTITANQMGVHLNNVIITDLLQGGLVFQSAGWQAWDGSNWGSSNSITPNASGEYAIGDIDSRILLTIVTIVPNDVYTASIKNYMNSATIRWDALPGAPISSGNISVPIGYNAITKSGAADLSERTVHWTVNVDTKEQEIPDLKVYDLLVYNTSINLSSVSGIPAGINTSDLTPRFDQKYIADTFASAGATLVVYPIMKDGLRVADLLEISGLSFTEVNTFTFDSLVTNPNVYASNTSTQVYNTASLFSANSKINSANAQVTYGSRMLIKNMLTAAAAANPAANINSAPATPAQGFNYSDHSVIFRLNVNANGMDLTDAENATGTILGTASIIDTLPSGWVFEEITSGNMYLIFNGAGQSNGQVTASDTTPDAVSGLSAVISGNTASFTFTSLDASYVILVKAKPTDEAVVGYFDENKTTTIRNNVLLNTQNWVTGVTSFQDVSVSSQILSKVVTIPEAGTLLWTVEYRPNELSHAGAEIEDTLPIGIDLRTDSSGALILTGGNITLNEMSLNANGSYTLGDEIDLILNENIIYNNATRILRFIIPESQMAYRLSYKTDITGGVGQVTNKVELIEASSVSEDDQASYVVKESDGEATLQRNGWIEIEKQDVNGAVMAGAQFTIFALDGTTIIRQGVTGPNGLVRLKVIPDGIYILRETAAPVGYVAENMNHILKVETIGTVAAAYIDSKTSVDANKITITNYHEGTVGNLMIIKKVEGNDADPLKVFNFTITLTGASGSYNYAKNGVPGGTVKSGDTVSLANGQNITVMGLPMGATYLVTEADYSGEGYSTLSTGTVGMIIADTTQIASFTNTKNSHVPNTGDSTPLLLLITILAGSLIVLIVLLVKRKKFTQK